jgi:hypothetical protein
MLNFIYVNGELKTVTAEYAQSAINRNDMTGMAHAEEIAQDATTLTERLHIAADRGEYTSPRFDVIEAPRVGEEVSRGFNGDYYPAGKIVKVSASLKRVTTDTGVVFNRVRQSDCWRNAGTWGMVRGHKSERNPHF